MRGPNVAVLRRNLANLLTEQGEVLAPGDRWVYDPATDTEVREVVTMWSGPMLIRPRSGEPTSTSSDAGPWFIDKYDVTLPANATAERGNLVKLTACPADPGMVGVEFRLLDVPFDQYQIARFCVAEMAD